jgi:hypothetical protein
MKAVEFLGQIDANNAIEVPAKIAAQIEQGEALRVIVLIPEAHIDLDWSHLTVGQFISGYAEGDSIYDKLPAR